MSALKSYTFGPAAGGAPTSMVILLHGVGADGQDLLGLAPVLAEKLPHTVFVSPDGAQPFDMAPMGRQWFSIREFTQEAMERGVKESAKIVDDFITQQRDHYGLKDENIALLGFSQGTMMALYVAPRRTQKLAGVLAYSGLLAGADGLNGDAICKLPIHLVHGGIDPVVPVGFYQMALQTLENKGFPVTGKMIPYLAHGIDDAAIESGAEFLQSHLGH